MKKRMICLFMALVLALSCTGALAVTYDGLWEKMQLQLVGNGLKGSASLSAQGSADWVKVINGLFADTTLEFRGIQSDNQKQYQAYFLRGEEQLGLTRLFSDGESWVLSSDLPGTEKLRFSAQEDLMQQLTAQEPGLNPSWYSVALALFQMDKEEFTERWTPTLEKYEQALELWITDYAAAPEVIREPGQDTQMRVTYEIPVSAIKAEAAALVRSMLGDDTLRGLLSSVMSEEQQAAYLNMGWADYYAQLLNGLELGGDATMERLMSLTGEQLYTKVLLPLSAEKTGYDTLMMYQTDAALTVSLAGSTDTLIFDLQEKDETTSGISMKGTVERQMADGGEGGFKTDFALLQSNRESTDDDGRQHEYKSLTLTLTPENEEPMTLTAMVHLHSKSANFNPTTLVLDATWTQGDDSLVLSATFKTASAWVLQDFDAAGAKDYAALSEAEKSDAWSGYQQGALSLLTGMTTAANTATVTDLATPDVLTELPTEEPSEAPKEDAA